MAYHDIIDDLASPYPYAVRASVFREQVAMVGQLGYRFVPLSELAETLVAGGSTSGKAAIVFDDALIGVHRNALPVLRERNLPWTLLPVTDHPGVSPPWWQEADRTMDLDEIREAVAAGAELCGHTATHLSLPDMSPGQVQDELVRSRELLSEWGGREVVDLCYPFGHQNARVRELVRASGYRTGWTFTNGRCHPGDEPLTLRRMAMHDELRGLHWARTLLRPRWTWPAVEDVEAGGGSGS
ncbi:hypothetical protein A605_13065 [Corynebacterium halotolerans YIM 70093 = DSM 44683]|uniref:NodB homology domain-containing protein n=2 Tax=Corynebacterium halotolerans TaxID=225326 RepID=M1N112_9CORY|nr:hypothetical protein A605_13065 [Corynebacterium halotolerans YIM 70093 = DSM 44683]